MSVTCIREALAVLAIGCFASASLAQGLAATDAASPESQAAAFFGQYLDAFNSGDAKAAAAMWAEDAVWRGDSSTTTGRAAIEQSLADVFAIEPGLKLTGQVEHVHRITDGVLSVDGTATTSTPGGEPSTSAYAAVIKRTGSGWKLTDVHEYPVPEAQSPSDKLQELAFLVGEWRDDTEGASVSTTVRWGTGGSFLVRSYTVVEEEGAELQGTQVIGWDARQQKFRSWRFDSTGGFGEGVWSRAGDEWVGRLTETLPDGALASATQVIRKIDNNTIEVSTVGRDVAGEPQASTPPVRVVRVASQEEGVAGGQ